MHDFKEVGVGVYKAEDTLSKEDCEYIYNFMAKNYNNPINNPNIVPWEQEKQNVLYYMTLPDRRMISIINKYKKEMADKLSEMYQENVQPHLTTIVLWQPGQQMPRHVDDGFQTPHRENLKVRKYTSVTYVNDDYEGGSTFIRNDGKDTPSFREKVEYGFPNNDFTDFISVPKTGVTLLFKADDSNAHGVNRLESGTRVVLSTWFTTETNPMFIEPYL